MLKKTITYEDYDGVVRKEDHYFNLNKAELLEMESSVDGGLQKLIEKISNENDNKRTIELFKDLIVRSYGEKSLDGKRFVKSKELTDEFMQTEAYTTMFMEILSDPDAATAFVKGILPKDLVAEAEKHITENT